MPSASVLNAALDPGLTGFLQDVRELLREAELSAAGRVFVRDQALRLMAVALFPGCTSSVPHITLRVHPL